MPARIFPVSRSFLSTDALAGRLGTAFGLQNVHCQLLTASIRDVYLVSSGKDRFIFYLYHAGSHTPAEIEGEWRFVDFLKQEGLPVIPAITTREETTLLRFVTPEGLRCGVLTRYQAGTHFRRRPSASTARILGETLARLHECTTGLETNFGRLPLDPRLQLVEATRNFAQAFPDRPDDVAAIDDAVRNLLTYLPIIPKETPFYGMIHGDVIRANVLVSPEADSITLIDFDLCGPGWRIYDLASFFITLFGAPYEREMRAAFLEGYMMVRSLKRVELEALPIYEAIRAVFSLGVPAGLINIWGRDTIEQYLEADLARLQVFMERLR